MRLSDCARLFSLGAIWGSSFIFMRIISPALGPVTTAAFRLLVAACALIVYCVYTRCSLHWQRNWWHYTVVGLLNSALPFLLYAYAALHIPACYSAVLNATSPFFGAFFAYLWLNEKLSKTNILGFVLGITGVIIFGCVGTLPLTLQVGYAALACLISAITMSIGSIYIKLYVQSTPPVALATGSVVVSTAFLLPGVFIMPPQLPITTTVLLNVCAFGLMCTALAYLLYYRLVADIGPAKALTVVFLLPVFGMIWSVIFLGETVTASMLLGCGIILSGTALIFKK